jgi:hypothetical protein
VSIVLNVQLVTDIIHTSIHYRTFQAINEPHFTPQYAYICMEMNNKDINAKVKTTTSSFKTLIILCCEDRFNSMHVHEQELTKSLKEIKDCKDQVPAYLHDIKIFYFIMNSSLYIIHNIRILNMIKCYRTTRKKCNRSTTETKRFTERDRWEIAGTNVLNKNRTNGFDIKQCPSLYRFMCELYKVKILSNQTLEMCIKHLLMSPKEETLECACNILKQIGKTLNHVRLMYTFY